MQDTWRLSLLSSPSENASMLLKLIHYLQYLKQLTKQRYAYKYFRLYSDIPDLLSCSQLVTQELLKPKRST